MRRVSEPEVIDLVSSDDDEVIDVDDEGWAAVAGSRRVAQQDEDDAALALRLQEEEYRGGGGGGPAPAAAAHAATHAAAAAMAEPVTELDWSRRHRAEQDAEYEASLAADRKREADARAAAEKAAAEKAAASRASALAAKAEADAEAAARDAAATKASARERWLAASEPPAGTPGVVSVALRFPDGAWHASRCLYRRYHRLAHNLRLMSAGSRVTARFSKDTLLSAFFEFVAAVGPLSLDTAFTVATGFPRKSISKPASGSLETLESAGFEASASAMVVPADT
jgi:hypothetical protein